MKRIILALATTLAFTVSHVAYGHTVTGQTEFDGYIDDNGRAYHRFTFNRDYHDIYVFMPEIAYITCKLKAANGDIIAQDYNRDSPHMICCLHWRTYERQTYTLEIMWDPRNDDRGPKTIHYTGTID